MQRTEATPDERLHEALVDGYQMMLGIRHFEERIHSLFMRGEVHGTVHLYNGQEAVATGVCGALDGDSVSATYRGHGAALALGVEPRALGAELMGRATGTNGGRSGSLNVIDREHHLLHTSGIIGGSIGCATGAALPLRGTGKVSVAFFGDGTTNHGYFHECLNFAKVLKLPVVFVCENNLYGEFTPWEDVTAGQIRSRPEAMEIHSVTIDGNNVWTVQEAAREAVELARAGEGPCFIEALTYRYVGHSRSDPGTYRKPGELDEWKQRDPLIVARGELTKRLGASAADIEAVDESVERQITEMVEQGLAAPYPTPGVAAEFKD